MEDVSPFLLGKDLGAIMGEAHRVHVREFLKRVTPEKLAAHGPARWLSADAAERALDMFRLGIERS